MNEPHAELSLWFSWFIHQPWV